MPALKRTMKPKPCKVCLETFTPQRAMQRACSVPCAIEYNNRVDAQNAEKRRKRALRLRKEGLRSKSEWAKLAQKEFNGFIRLRDEDLPCISCNRHHTGQYHAGHYRTVGGQGSALRFNEIGCHKQCMPCNSHKSGNISEYRIGLIKKIGIELVEWLEKDHPRTKAWTVEELQAIRKYYREAQKAMKLSSSS